MKQNFLLYGLILGLCCFVWACKQDNTKKEWANYYGSGAVSKKVDMVNGKQEGIMRSYYPGGELQSERYFHEGIQQGKTVVYYRSGALKEVQYYNDKGQRINGDTVWYENGPIQFIANFKENKKDGFMRKWGTDGKLILETRYAMDTLVEAMGQKVRPQ